MTVQTLKAFDGEAFEVDIALPKGGQGSGLLLIHGIFGVNDDLREIAAGYAEKGYVVLSPSLYWRQEPHVDLPFNDPESLDHALNLYKGFDIEAGVRDLLAALAALRQNRACTGKVGALGYCLGARLAYLMAARSDIDCAVGYYCVGIESLLDEAYDIRFPMLLHIAEQDKFIQPSALQKILRVLGKNKIIQTEIYAGVDHGFARKRGPKYNPQAAERADALTEQFLYKYLQS